MLLSLRGFALSLIFFGVAAFATETSVMNSSVRGLGMGDAFTALADDSSALFYNPAGLANVRGINWKIFSIQAGASGLDTYNKIRDLRGSDTDGYADGINRLMGDHVWTGLSGESIFYMPMFAFGVYNHGDALIRVDNPVNPEIYTSVINDFGYVAGFGVPFSPFLQMGMDFKYIKRTGARMPYGASFLADLNPNAIYNNVTGWGTGYGADFGMNFILPAPFFSATVSAVWRNIGEIQFRSGDPNADIPSEPNDVTLGTALQFKLPLLSISPEVDFHYLNREDLQLTRKINFGIEIGLPLLDIRGGFHEGYYTAGLGLNLGLFKVDLATYGVELGAYPGQIEDRRYVLSFSMDLGVGNFSADGARSSDGKKSGSSSSSDSNFWGRGSRLKQRR